MAFNVEAVALARANANLAKGLEVRSIARRMVDDFEYRVNLMARMRSGKIAPAVELRMWDYAYGQPKQQIDLQADVSFRWMTPDDSADVIDAVANALPTPEPDIPKDDTE